MPIAPRMDMLVTPRSTKLMATFVLVLMLCLFIVMTGIFYASGVMPLAIADCVSVGIYLVLLVLLYREYWRTFAALIFAQVYVHNALAVYFIGWNAQFQLTTLALIVLGFYAEYAARAMRVKTLHAMTFAIVGLVLYLVLLVFGANRVPPYILPADVTLGFQVLWSVVVFAIVTVYLQIFMLIARNAEEVMSNKATHDELTGLPNRYHMSDYLNQMAAEIGLEGCWVAMVDIDDFKHTNDTYGHNCGDYVLKALADLMRLEATGYEVCRWGGEEFLLSGSPEVSAERPHELLERLRKTVDDHSFWYEDIRLHLTITIGLAEYREGQSIGEWVNAADKKLYEGKCSGKNQLVF